MDANVDSTRTAGQQASAQDAQAAPELAAPQAKPAKKAVPDAANFRLLEEACASYLDAEGMEKAERAYRFAADFHRDQRRRSGEPYINHPVEVALILSKDLHMDEDTICAALLHDTVEDTPATLEQLTDLFGQTVAELVDGVTKLTSIKVTSMDEKQAWNLRKMFVGHEPATSASSSSSSPTACTTCAPWPPCATDRRLFKARETHGRSTRPSQHRLGITSVKWELEDLAFFWLGARASTSSVARMVTETPAPSARTYAQSAIDDPRRRAARNVGLQDYQITGRPKHLWSIYHKMTKQGPRASPRSTTSSPCASSHRSVGDCYRALGAVHTPVAPHARPLQRLHRHAQGQHVPVAAHHGHGPGGPPLRGADPHRGDAPPMPSTASPPTGATRRRATPAARRAPRIVPSTPPSTGCARCLDWAAEDDMDDPHEFLEVPAAWTSSSERSSCSRPRARS